MRKVGRTASAISPSFSLFNFTYGPGTFVKILNGPYLGKFPYFSKGTFFGKVIEFVQFARTFGYMYF